MIYLICFTDILTNNPVIQKTIVASTKASGITNSRVDFNNYLTNIFLFKLNPIERLTGISIDELRHYMYLRYGTELHAHNDVYNSLLGLGLIGFLTYAIIFYNFCRVSVKPLIVGLVLFILLFTNGLYMYLAFTPSVGVLLVYSSMNKKALTANETIVRTFIQVERLNV